MWYDWAIEKPGTEVGREGLEMANKTCTIEGCDKNRYYAKDWCVMHYRRWQRNGDPLARRVYRGDPAGAIAARSSRRGACLVWTGALSEDGYGIMKTSGRTRQAHLVAWELSNGSIPPGAQIDRSCHERSCVNVDHLRLASHSENQWNRKGARSRTGHRNVYETADGRYYVQIRHNYEKINYGTYSSVEEAARVAERARRELFGEFAGRG